MNDLIYKQDAINLLKKWADGYSYIEHETELAIKAFEQLPPVSLKDKVILDKEPILQAGYQRREVEFRIGGRLFAIREIAQ